MQIPVSGDIGGYMDNILYRYLSFEKSTTEQTKLAHFWKNRQDGGHYNNPGEIRAVHPSAQTCAPLSPVPIKPGGNDTAFMRDTGSKHRCTGRFFSGNRK
jgi:hypothetical protein